VKGDFLETGWGVSVLLPLMLGSLVSYRGMGDLPSSLLLPHFSPQCLPQMGVAMVEAAMEAAMARVNFMLIDLEVGGLVGCVSDCIVRWLCDDKKRIDRWRSTWHSYIPSSTRTVHTFRENEVCPQQLGPRQVC
jgi:hypothetical protein